MGAFSGSLSDLKESAAKVIGPQGIFSVAELAHNPLESV
jgi:hypothetical protein